MGFTVTRVDAVAEQAFASVTVRYRCPKPQWLLKELPVFRDIDKTIGSCPAQGCTLSDFPQPQKKELKPILRKQDYSS